MTCLLVFREQMRVPWPLMIQTNINFESDDEEDEDRVIFCPTTTALKAQEHLQEHLHVTPFEGLNMRVNTSERHRSLTPHVPYQDF